MKKILCFRLVRIVSSIFLLTLIMLSCKKDGNFINFKSLLCRTWKVESMTISPLDDRSQNKKEYVFNKDHTGRFKSTYTYGDGYLIKWKKLFMSNKIEIKYFDTFGSAPVINETYEVLKLTKNELQLKMVKDDTREFEENFTIINLKSE